MSIVFKASITGLKQLRRQMDKAGKEIRGAVAAAIYQKGLAIMADSKKQVPVDKGFLKGSGYVAPPKSDKGPEVEIGYGKKYGPAVHERYEVFHKVGKPRFLRDPINDHKRGYTRWIQKKARENKRRGVSWTGVPSSEPMFPAENRKG